MAHISVYRNSANDVGHRQVLLWIDGEPLGTLTYQQSVTREIAAGRHTLKAYNTLVTKTLEFEVREEESAAFVTANVTSGWMFSALALLGVGPLGLTLERVLPADQTTS